jgi:acyl-CoA synthetase (NDP forming)
MCESLEAIKSMLNPRSIAIIGASEDPAKLSGLIIPNLIRGGFKGKIYPVNPKRAKILGLTCYSSVKIVPEDVTIALIIVPRHTVLETLNECADKGIKVALILTAGFGELGAEGKKIEKEMIRLARKAGMRICGPNCEGLISMATSTWLSTMIPLKPVSGDIALITQSGGVGEYVISGLWERGVGISHWISSGNEADLNISDYIEYLVQDPYTRVIAIFVESIRDGDKFRKVAEMAAAAEKPIVALKVGKSEKGKLTALSHTGALAGSDEVYDAVFKQLGIIRVRHIEDLVTTPMAFSWQPLVRGNKVCVISLSGGIACLWADDLCDAGLELPDLSKDTLLKLKELLPHEATIKNPLDMTAVAFFQNIERLDEFVEPLSKDCDSILLYIPDLVLTDKTLMKAFIARVQSGIIKAAEKMRKTGKPFLLCSTASTRYAYPEFIRSLIKHKIPIYEPHMAVEALRAMVRYRGFLNRSMARH